MIKALVFDCFGVFYIDPVFAHMRDPQTPAAEADALHMLDEQAARGKLPKTKFVERASRLLHLSQDEVERRFFHSDNRNQELITLVQGLRTRYKVALLSNIGVDMMDGFFTPGERKELFDEVILSGEVGYAKPDLEIFEFACNKLDIPPAETVMIDDVRCNVDAAKRLGMQGVCYENFAQFKTDLAVILPESLG